ncbi:hypothetical protein KY290_033107 [Solanum tuberosum]|uniref:Uncharacterized protein n=1 Tax=Solanum tuberosum TaxID=4113 RepID=A0ABQ7TZB5_SOLTU|nr:hypothetical protein KY285_032354 [Solanum tuberosum]KAH0740064.1 hypothetical protein KY290_033107 [Solanum tuberosum]
MQLRLIKIMLPLILPMKHFCKFGRVSQIVENIVADNGLHQSYASDHTKANISNVMHVKSSPFVNTRFL